MKDARIGMYIIPVVYPLTSMALPGLELHICVEIEDYLYHGNRTPST
jgi:hypothetical protein